MVILVLIYYVIGWYGMPNQELKDNETSLSN